MQTQPRLSVQASWLEIAKACGAYYECPKDQTGNRLGPLAAYTARDEAGRQLVGDVYLDFARIEQWPNIVRRLIIPKLISDVNRTVGHKGLVWCGMPEGGKSLAELLAEITNGRFVYPEKTIIAPATSAAKAKSAPRFTGRHIIHPGDRVAIVEDVTNNFSTSEDGIQQIEQFGAEVVCIVSFLNRSPFVRDPYDFGDRSIPVISAWDEAMEEYRQDDPHVAHDIQAGNVEFEPKQNWERMQAAMRAA